jgi:hypothetical protein
MQQLLCAATGFAFLLLSTSAGTTAQTGIWRKNFLIDDGAPLKDSEIMVTVNFPRPFSKVPKVTLALEGMHFEKKRSLRVYAEVVSVTQFRFQFTVRTWADTWLWRAHFTWFAAEEGSPCQSRSIGWRWFDPKLSGAEVFNVTFPIPYAQVPNVTLAFAGLDTATWDDQVANHRMDSDVVSKTTTGFSFKVGSWGGSALSGFDITWFASAPSTQCQTGTWNKKWWMAGSGGSLAGKELHWVAFPVRFADVPHVTLSLSTVDVSGQLNTRISLQTEMVANNCFEFTVDSPGSETFAVAVTWLALPRDSCEVLASSGDWTFLQYRNGNQKISQMVGARRTTTSELGNEITTSWTRAVAASIRAGFSFGFGVDLTVTESVANDMSTFLSNSFTGENWEETTNEVDFPAGAIWQFQYLIHESCGDSTIRTSNLVVTQGSYAPPCCLPGYA